MGITISPAPGGGGGVIQITDEQGNVVEDEVSEIRIDTGQVFQVSDGVVEVNTKNLQSGDQLDFGPGEGDFFITHDLNNDELQIHDSSGNTVQISGGEMRANGVKLNDDNKITLGVNDDVEIYWDSGNSQLVMEDTNTFNSIRMGGGDGIDFEATTINIPTVGQDPSSPEVGDIWYRSDLD